MTPAPAPGPGPATGAEAVGISFFDLDSDQDIALGDAWALLSEAETARAHRFRFDIHKARYVRGRGYLRRALIAHLGHDAAALEILEGTYGKPYIAHEPLEFNLSHSRDRAVLAVLAGTARLGVDIEYTDRASDLLDLAKTCFTKTEQSVLHSLPVDMLRERFFEFWTAKEARMKLTGEGMALTPKSISLSLQNGRVTGYDDPHTPRSSLHYISLPRPDMTCCLVREIL